jgi:uroporphyrinogen decarboxylase
MSDDRTKAMRFEHPEFIPVSVSLLPAAWMKYRRELDELVARHPVIFGEQSVGERDYDAVGGTYVAGSHTDEWGCVWENVATGMEAMVKHHPVPTRADVWRLRAPAQVTGQFKHGFMYLRLQDLRGFEEVMLDFAEEPPELQRLIGLVLGWNLANLEKMLEGRTGPGLLYFGDDLGMQASLPMSPATWRKHLKPCFAAIYGRCHAAGFDVYMHTDGHIWEIIPDLIECGVNVVNPQVRANGLANLARVCKGKVCVNLDLDRQMFPFGTPAEIDAHVREAVETLGLPEGGLWLVAECAPDVPLRNIEAICEALERYRGYFR